MGYHDFSDMDMRIRVKGGHTCISTPSRRALRWRGYENRSERRSHLQIYAITKRTAKTLVSFYQKYMDEQSKKDIKDILVSYDRTVLVADPRRCEPKKF